MDTYTVRWKNSRNQLRESSSEPWTLRQAIEYASSICKGYDTEVVVIENGSLICIVTPDER